MTDEALMLEVSKRNIESASVLYDRYSKKLYNYFVKISFDRESGHDLMQTTFLRMIKYKHTYKEGKAFQTWIFQIARNVFADHLKKNKLQISDHIDVYELDQSSRNEESRELEQKEKTLHMAMAKLPEESREILVLSRFQEMKYEQIAKVMNLTVPAVKVKVHRAIKKLRIYYMEIENI
jgi:RNA polymerase sigma factor (sigma-70 family)